MGKHCSVPGCRDHQKLKRNQRSYFYVKRPELAHSEKERQHRQVLQDFMKSVKNNNDILRLQFVKESANICDAHFKPEDLIVKGNGKMLKIGAIPSLNVPETSYFLSVNSIDRCYHIKDVLKMDIPTLLKLFVRKVVGYFKIQYSCSLGSNCHYRHSTRFERDGDNIMLAHLKDHVDQFKEKLAECPMYYRRRKFHTVFWKNKQDEKLFEQQAWDSEGRRIAPYRINEQLNHSKVKSRKNTKHIKIENSQTTSSFPVENSSKVKSRKDTKHIKIENSSNTFPVDVKPGQKYLTCKREFELTEVMGPKRKKLQKLLETKTGDLKTPHVKSFNKDQLSTSTESYLSIDNDISNIKIVSCVSLARNNNERYPTPINSNEPNQSEDKPSDSDDSEGDIRSDSSDNESGEEEDEQKVLFHFYRSSFIPQRKEAKNGLQKITDTKISVKS
ncbi:uncharacterized protein LOC100184150 isoform X2 [Ciona intestinalis]